MVEMLSHQMEGIHLEWTRILGCVNERWGKQGSGGKWKKNESNHPFPRFQSEIWYYVCWVSDLFICKSHCTSLKMPCPRKSKKIHQHLSLYSLCLYRLTSRIFITMVYLRCPQWVPMYPFWHRQWSSLQLPPFMQRMLQCWTWKGKKKKTDLFLQFKHIDSNSSRELICSEEKIKWFLKIHIFMQK